MNFIIKNLEWLFKIALAIAGKTIEDFAEPLKVSSVAIIRVFQQKSKSSRIETAMVDFIIEQFEKLGAECGDLLRPPIAGVMNLSNEIVHMRTCFGKKLDWPRDNIHAVNPVNEMAGLCSIEATETIYSKAPNRQLKMYLLRVAATAIIAHENVK